MKRKERWLCAVLLVATALVLAISSLAGRERAQVFAVRDDLPTLVIDAGHGGFDGGAVGPSGTSEQDINLSIARSLQALAGCLGYPVRMTREDSQALDYVEGRAVRENKVADIHAREQIVQSCPNAEFISIHLNKFEDPQYFGAQVFYSRNHAGSALLAEHIQRSLIDGIDNNNIRRAKPAAPAIYLMKNLTCPAVIVECGFLSNPEEESRLREPGYHRKLAVCILSGYHTYRNGAEHETEDPISMQ